jgi:hypothetical protein
VTSFLELKLLIEQLIATAKDILGRYSNLCEVIIPVQYQTLSLEIKTFLGRLSFVGKKKCSCLGIGCSKKQQPQRLHLGRSSANRTQVGTMQAKPTAAHSNFEALASGHPLIIFALPDLRTPYHGNVSGIVRS